MIKEYYYKPDLVPPFSLFVYVCGLFWKLKELKYKKATCKKCNEVSPGDNINGSTNKNKSTENQIRKQNLISNWTNELKFYGEILI